MRVIILGSKGFIGENLYNYLNGNGHDVWGADIISGNFNNKKYFLIESNTGEYDDVFNYHVYDVCINCAGAANVPESLKNPLQDYQLNAFNVFKILESIRRFQPQCRFLNLSSAAVYGNPEYLPINENFRTNPISPYGFHKLNSEYICKEFWDVYSIQTCSLRIFSVYGAGLKKQLFWDLYNKTKQGIPISLFGTGNESRDYIYILDLVRAIELVLILSPFNAEILNIANGEEIFIKDAVSIFYNFFENEIEYSFSGEARSGDPVNWVADISKLISLGYCPSIDIKTGLQNYYEWLTKN